MSLHHIPTVALTMTCVLLAACSGTSATRPLAGQQLPVVWKDADSELRRAPDFRPDASTVVHLGSIQIEGEDKAPESTIRDYSRLREALGQTADNASGSGLRVDISLEALSPASIGLNLLSAALVLIPLDAGALTVHSRYTNTAGQLVAERFDRLHGQKLLLRGVLTPYGRVEPELVSWAQQCTRSAACLIDDLKLVDAP